MSCHTISAVARMRVLGPLSLDHAAGARVGSPGPQPSASRCCSGEPPRDASKKPTGMHRAASSA